MKADISRVKCKEDRFLDFYLFNDRNDIKLTAGSNLDLNEVLYIFKNEP